VIEPTELVERERACWVHKLDRDILQALITLEKIPTYVVSTKKGAMLCCLKLEDIWAALKTEPLLARATEEIGPA
jgi:hypothetical protein